LEKEIGISQKVDEVKSAVLEFKEKISELINDLHIDLIIGISQLIVITIRWFLSFRQK